MSDDNFYFNPENKDPGETTEQAKSHQKEQQEKQKHAEEVKKAERDKITPSPTSSMPITDTISSEPVKLSSVGLYLGIPLLILAFLIGQDYLPFSDVKLFGLPLARVLLFAGLLCVAFKYMVKIAGILLIGAGAIGMLGTVAAILSGVAISSVIPNLALSGGAIGIGMLIIRASMREK